MPTVRRRLTPLLVAGPVVAVALELGACTVPGGGAVPVAAPTSATTSSAEDVTFTPRPETTGTLTAPPTTPPTTPPTVTVTSVPPTLTATSVPPSPTTTRATPRSTPSATRTPAPSATTKAAPKPATPTPRPSTGAPAPQTPASGSAVSGCGNPNPGKVFLTFDDGGPRAGAILDILGRYGITARWFPTGQWAAANRATVQRIIAAGQLMGNHTYSHPQMYASLGQAELARQVDQGYRPTTVFRFPYGASDATSRAVVRAKGYSICGWSIDTNDWRGNSADTITSIVTGQARPGAVVLMHLSFQADVDALPRIIENLRGRGLI